MKKLLLVLAAALTLSVQAFAVDGVYFSESPLSFADSRYEGICEETDATRPVYFYAISGRTINAISEISDAPFRTGIASVGSGDDPYFSSAVCSNSVGDYYGYPCYSLLYGAVSTEPSIALFPSGTTDAEISAAFLDFLENPPAPVPAVSSSFTVPCGNVLYFKVDREQDVTFTAVMPVLSSLLGTPTGAWNSGIQYGPAASLPTSDTTFPILSQDPINFAKTVSNQNLLGQTKNAISTKHCIAGQYYALYLPYHYGGWLALGSSHVYPDGSTSGGIVGANVTVSGSFAEIKVYPLTEKANGDLLTGSVTLDSGSDDGFASYFDGEISETGTVTWLDQNGDISSPSVGGTSYVPEDVSTESIIDQIKNILGSIVSEIKNLFSFGYEAVNTLVGLMHDFVGVFKQLYEWLPAEVYSALVSAIIVAITIGVFKVFL